MPLIALYWDQRRILVAIARRVATRTVFDRAVAVELVHFDDEGPLEPRRLKDKLQAVLQANGVSRGDATVVVARGSIEMRQFVLPPVPENELPELVRYQARSHFNALNDDWSLDFIPISSSSSGKSNSVLAAAISPQKMQEITDIVESTGLRLRHIVVRPFASVELLRSVAPDAPCQITVELSGREANLSVVDCGNLLFTRTVRVPETYTNDQFDSWLPGEIQRTIAAACNQSDAPDVQKIIVFGKSSEHERLKHGLAESFDIETEFFNPFDAVTLSREFESPDRFDGFASLLGSIVQQFSPDQRSIDFVNPRRKEESHDLQRKLTMAAAVAACLLVIGLLACWWVLRSRDAEIAELQKENRDLAKVIDKADERIAEIEKIDQWKRTDVSWLDELYELSARMLFPDDAIVDSFGGNISNDQLVVEISGRASDLGTLDVLAANLAARPYELHPRSSGPAARGGFGSEFRTSLRISLDQLNRDFIEPTTAPTSDAAAPQTEGEPATPAKASLTPDSEEKDVPKTTLPNTLPKTKADNKLPD